MDPLWITSLAILLCVSVLLRRILSKIPPSSLSKWPSPQRPNEKPTPTPEEIQPLLDFDWKTKEPVQYRRFKPKYHLTMAVEKSSLSELIEMDRNYPDRTAWRRRIIRDHAATVVGADRAACAPAIEEFYVWLLGTYLPTRFPSMFELVSSSSSSSPVVSDEEEKGGAATTTCRSCLLREGDGDGYVSFLWAMNLSDNPFTPGGTKLYEGNEKPEGVEVDINQVYLRSERQIVHRLPKTGAIVFSFKTYLYPIAGIKAEGLGEELATAIDGLKLGSVPGFTRESPCGARP